jgi:site-specific DNA-methyltransferase (cytosine-N4-specific)
MFRELPGGAADVPPGRRLARVLKYAGRAGLRCTHVEELTDEEDTALATVEEHFWVVLEEGVEPVRWARRGVASWIRQNRLAPRTVQVCPDGGREWGTADAFGFTCPPPPPPPKALAVAQAAPEASQAPDGPPAAVDAPAGPPGGALPAEPARPPQGGLPDVALPRRLEYGPGGELLRVEAYGPEAPAWRVDQADCLDWLAALPEGCADLCFFSPPYEQARTYQENGVDLGIARNTDEWVRWMVAVFRACRRACRGLVACVCEGQTKGYRYSAGPLLLAADLHRAGFHLRKPPIFHRVGTPGSGSKDWLRNDYELILCTTRGGRLPWSDPTACGHPPKYKPGGDPSHRMKEGSRVNGKRHTKRRADGTTEGQVYKPPKIANPGNVIQQAYSAEDLERLAMQRYTAEEAAAVWAERGDVVDCNVGGGRMGSTLAHENEAPFPEHLAEFFVRSFCPPGGLIIDPFCGSGTTGAVAVRLGRRFLGCDLRQSQVDLSRRRLAPQPQEAVNAEAEAV